MTREDIVRMAKGAGFLVDEADFITAPKNGRIGFQTELDRFAALVAAHEREACVKICDGYAQYGDSITNWAVDCAAAIRAREIK